MTSCGDDDSCTETTWFEDADGDGLGNPDVTVDACDQPDGFVADNTDTDDTNAGEAIISVDPNNFQTDNASFSLTLVDCTLSDGTATTCYEVVTNTIPRGHEMGPWCPDNIADDASAGGIWLEGGVAYDVDGAFIENMANFYNDNTWLMYDANGDVFVTETEDDCINAANPNVGDAYRNFCVECLPSYITDVSASWLIPVTPVQQDRPTFFATGPGGPPGGNQVPSTRGVALSGVEFSAPAPTSNILAAYTLAPFDDAGGHINVNQGYHYHAATGISFEVEQSDGHAGLVGYALDGYGIYNRLDAEGNEPTDLDECRGHSDDIRGYHYHLDAPGNNNFINCLQGAYAN
ncbi:YHYH protein [Saprospiraceae bacterium]|nr:YHYH protein [Saprospiraceae bacterium]